ncbi:MAG: DUF3631 domain-containing protein [Solirubrobacterales bacterium]|nr:DUF3631 domain-containing protein [Solirubrobacterales bacterium]
MPTRDQTHKWHMDLMSDDVLLRRLLVLKGWSAKALTALEIGFDGQRVTIPYLEWEQVANVMRYRAERPITETGPKMLPYSNGHGRCLFPEVETVPEGRLLFLVEGEPDAITAISLGLCAIAVPGANSWRKSYVEELEGRRVVVCFDDDPPGKKLAEKVVADLTEAGTEVRVLDLGTENTDGIKGFDLGDYAARAVSEAEPDEDVEALLEQVGLTLLNWAENTDPEKAEETRGSEVPAEEVPEPSRSLPEILDEVEQAISTFVVLPSPEAGAALALWTVHTWAFEAAHATPYMLVISAEKRSGKTRLLEILTALVRRPWATVDVSEAALFRKIAQDRPTCLIDEIDAIFSSATERTAPLRATINAGNPEGGSVARCAGDDMKVVDFNVFSPKLLAGIDKGERLPDTIRDRSVTIQMVRKTSDEPVRRLLLRKVHPLLENLRGDLEGWASRNVEMLSSAEPDLPAELDDRAAEAWEPLLAIADLAGVAWGSKARDAAKALSSNTGEEGQTHGGLLLAAIRDLMGSKLTIATKDVLLRVNHREELPFGAWRDGEGIDARGLARLLKPYGVRAKKVHISDGQKVRGYHRDDLSEAWSRWLPTPASLGKEPAELQVQVEPEVPQDRAKVPQVPHKDQIGVPADISGPTGSESDRRTKP